jgi:hypothetical protein
MALQPFVGRWPLFSFLIFYTVGKTPWTGDQPFVRPLPTHTRQHKQNKHKQTSILQVGFEPTIPAFERAKTVNTLDSAATAVGMQSITLRTCLICALWVSFCNSVAVHSSLLLPSELPELRKILIRSSFSFLFSIFLKIVQVYLEMH